MAKDLSYSLTKPCNNCPFRNDIKPFIRPERVDQIEQACVNAEFPCHKTTEHDEDEDGYSIRVDNADTKHCAGALILMEKANCPSQMMRICERLGIYDRTKLDMEAPVYEDWEDMRQAHEDQAR